MSAPNADSPGTRWFPALQAVVGARIRLFCFPYAGGSYTAFHGWQRIVPPDIHVCPVELPGHISRLAEAPLRRMDALIDALLRALAPHLETPFAFFGHSMGALVAFELARRLQRDRCPPPIHLFVAGRPAPHLHGTRSRWAGLTDDEFLAELALYYRPVPEPVLRDPEMRRALLRMMRADFDLVESYACGDGAPLRIPLTAIGGTEDRTVSRDALVAWSRHTSTRFEALMLEGGHFFLESARSELVTMIGRRLAVNPPHREDGGVPHVVG
jgi:surfactin synthase thioesterase subunit